MTIAVIKTPTQTVMIAQSGPVPGINGLYVFFREKETVFHWGEARDLSITPGDFGSYSADICADDGTVLRTYTLPHHWFYTRWVDKPVMPTIKNSVKSLYDQGYLAPFGTLFGKPAPRAGGYIYTGPMSLGGITPYMPTTGERADIGFDMEPVARYLATGLNPEDVIAVAMGTLALPIHIMDDRTYGPFDLDKDFQANTSFRHEGSTPLNTEPEDDPVSYDIGHMPNAAYEAALLTEEEIFLEAVQYMATTADEATSFYQRYPGDNNTFNVMDLGQGRAMAWQFRANAMAQKATEFFEALYAKQGKVWPSYLLHSTVFRNILDKNLGFLTTQYQQDPAIQTFRMFPSEAGPAPWQDDMELIVFGMIAYWWPQKWGSFYLWKLGSGMPRVDGAHGWPEACPGTYRLILGPGFVMDQDTTQPRKLQASQFFPTWKSAWDNFAANSKYGMTDAQLATLASDPMGGGQWQMWDPIAAHYVLAWLSIAVWIDKQKIPGLDISGAWPGLQVAWQKQMNFAKARLTIQGWSIPFRVAYDAMLPAPTGLANFPPTNQPPAGEPPMSNDIVSQIAAAVAQIKTDVAADIAAAHARIQAVIAAAQGNAVDPAALAAPLADLQALHATLTADTAALPTATS